MRKFGLTLVGAVGLVASLMSGQAYALVCVGPITPLVPNSVVPLSEAALGGGACFSAGDKTFGNFSISPNVPPGGIVRFGFGPGTAIPHRIEFLNGLFPADATITTQFEVRDDLPDTQISDLTANFTGEGSAVLHTDITIVGGPNAGPFPPGGLTCSNPPLTCPSTLLFPADTADIVVGDTLTTGVDFTGIGGGEAIINTVSQTAVPEPASLILLGSALAGLGWFRRRKTA